jgi:hypothetical protein
MRGLVVSRRQILKALGATAALGAALGPEAAFADHEDNRKVSWDIINLDFTNNHVTSGGHASAFANDNSKITITGSGTFRANSGHPEDVTGGGTWETSGGAVGAGSGTYRVTKLVTFTPAPGTPPPQNVDMIGPGPGHAGLVTLRVRYSNGMEGVLTVSCHLVGTPDSVFEGITASMGFNGFWSREAPSPGVNADRTVFHFLGHDS